MAPRRHIPPSPRGASPEANPNPRARIGAAQCACPGAVAARPAEPHPSPYGGDFVGYAVWGGPGVVGVQTARSIQALVDDITGPEVGASGLRITHIVEQRVPRVNGLRPHVHAYVGATVLSPTDGRETPVDVEQLTALGESVLFGDHCRRLVAATAERVGLVWREAPGSSCELVGPPWLVERTAESRHDDVSCRGPWPRRQIEVGRQTSRRT